MRKNVLTIMVLLISGTILAQNGGTFMKKYEKSDGTDPQMIADYGKYINKYTEMAASFAEWEDEDLNAAETAYYIRVQGRVSQKLLEVAQEI